MPLSRLQLTRQEMTVREVTCKFRSSYCRCPIISADNNHFVAQSSKPSADETMWFICEAVIVILKITLTKPNKNLFSRPTTCADVSLIGANINYLFVCFASGPILGQWTLVMIRKED
jgi:hypothetical protein